MKKVPVTTFGLCERCLHRFDCENRSKTVSECRKDEVDKNKKHFEIDYKKRARIEEVNREEIQNFIKGLKRTDAKQVRVTEDFNIFYKPKNRDVRRFNSRSNTTIKVDNNGLDLKRFCENCGKHFHTVNKSRRLCDDCHDEICETLGVDYSVIPAYDDKRSEYYEQGDGE